MSCSVSADSLNSSNWAALLNWLKAVPSPPARTSTPAAVSSSARAISPAGGGCTSSGQAAPTKSVGSSGILLVSSPLATSTNSASSLMNPTNAGVMAAADCLTSLCINHSSSNSGGQQTGAGSGPGIAAGDSDEDTPAILGDERRKDLAKSFQRDVSGKFNCAFCPYSTEHHGSMKNHQMTHTGKLLAN